MTLIQKTKWLIWATTLALVMACVPSLSTPSTPAIDPGTINTFIAQTARAAFTQTAALLPSATATPLVTPTLNTETPTPTATATVVFVFYSPTPLVSPTFTPSGSSSDNYACQVMRMTPPNGTSFGSRQDFDVIWTVKNIGKKKWDHGSVDYFYSSGEKIHKISSYDLEDSVASGGTIDLGADMQAPKNPGTYTTTWVMRNGSKIFCPMTITIVVKSE
jgi:hypothetical protein